MANLNMVGEITPKAAIFKSESGKLCHSFPVATGKTILQGQLVVLNTDGTIRTVEADADLSKVIGVAITNSPTPAYVASRQYGSVEVTVAMKGFAIVWGYAAGVLNAGPVKPNAVVAQGYSKYVQSVLGGATPDAGVTAIALNAATADLQLIQILIL